MSWWNYIPIASQVGSAISGNKRDFATSMYATFDPIGGNAMTSSNEQQDVADEAAHRAEIAGDKAADYSTVAGQQAMQYGQQGMDAAAEQYRQALASYQQQQAGLGSMFAPEIQAGQESLQGLNAAVLGGDMSQLQLDPSYQFQSEEAQKALARRANAAGMYGSGGNIKDAIRTQQGMASQAYGDAINRLMGSATQGQAANQTLQQLNAQNANGIYGVYGALANNYSEGNRFLANTQLNTTVQAANARANLANTVNGFNLQAANAQAQGIANVGNNLQNVANTAAYYQAKS